jgi:uncharacterized phage protein (TIGR01671 family)
MYKVSTLDFYDADGGGEATLVGESRQSSAFFDDIVLMQYTGLTDRNGVEIWEGDVLTNGRNEYKVVFHEGGVTVQNLDSENAMPASLNFLSVFAHTELTVIGNIYENPEPLEKKR